MHLLHPSKDKVENNTVELIIAFQTSSNGSTSRAQSLYSAKSSNLLARDSLLCHHSVLV